MSRIGKYSLAIVPLPKCEHKCHTGLGLNPWIEECPICHCPNPKFDPKVEAPHTIGELFARLEEQE